MYAYSFPVENKATGYFLLYELAEKGSLDVFLNSDSGRSRLSSFRRRVQIAVDIITAIRFLHVGNREMKSCFHRDIKSANVVIKGNFTAQLIDCGLAKFVHDNANNTTSTGDKGTTGYVCPCYAMGIPYEAACDIYSFGVVLTELWTGKLQNHKDESGSVFNFGMRYGMTNRDMKLDIDVSMDCKAPLPDFMVEYADLALQCMKQHMGGRPTGDEVFDKLGKILKSCNPHHGLSRQVVQNLRNAVPPATSNGTKTCPMCRTLPIFHSYGVCMVCAIGHLHRQAFDKILSKRLAPVVSEIKTLCKDHIRFRNEDRQVLCEIDKKFDGTLTVLSHLDFRFNNQVPLLFLLVPAERKHALNNPKSWLRSKVQTTYHLYFICAVTHQPVSPALKFRVSKAWVDKIAPVLAASLFILKASLTFGLNLDLCDELTERLHVSVENISQMLACLQEHNGLIDRLNSKKLTAQDIQELSGDAYTLIVEKACEQKEWRSKMEPVRTKHSPQILWVSKDVAQDPKFTVVKV